MGNFFSQNIFENGVLCRILCEASSQQACDRPTLKYIWFCTQPATYNDVRENNTSTFQNTLFITTHTPQKNKQRKNEKEERIQWIIFYIKQTQHFCAFMRWKLVFVFVFFFFWHRFNRCYFPNQYLFDKWLMCKVFRTNDTPYSIWMWLHYL